jgi:sugar/nucleoside kinase (ribokinase family)
MEIKILMKDSFEIIVCGHLCLDLIPQMENISAQAMLAPGKLLEVGPLSFSTGGLVSNTGIVLKRLGVNVGLMANVGDDLIGQIIVGSLRERDPSLVQHIKVQSGQAGSYTLVLSPERSDRTFLHCTGTNSVYEASDIDYAALTNAKIFHFGYPPLLPRLVENNGRGLTEVYQRAKATGIVTSLDMVVPDPQSATGRADWRQILTNTLPYVDIFLPSIEEILFMLHRDDYERWQGNIMENLSASYLSNLTDELLGMGVVIAGVKLGPMGLYLKTADQAKFERLRPLPLDISSWANIACWQPAFQVDVVGTTGAGDAAYSGFMASLLRGFGPEEVLRWACAVGACNVEAADSTSGVRTWQEIQKRLEAGWSLRGERLRDYRL